ncbi:arylsulfotransferase family protein [Saccharopolyspora sp. K220]|uniref:arylsulfotransferase family protein n=1 Tax=Saccharopolyspora soli TaxID=2926618 RepID=UPI001F55CC57|nr:arylsulfotransferase family protein [Saccharopolyspora soli]MCI2423292.1 arylsulfotransferase family protein [Saccharopolyspora soli]
MPADKPTLGRRSVLRMLAAAPVIPAALVGAGTAAQAASRSGGTLVGQDLVSRPDLHPPLVEIITPAAGTEPGYVLLTPVGANTLDPEAAAPPAGVQPGALIMDDTGQPVWFGPAAQGVIFNLQVQQYQGKPVLTHWEGSVAVPPGFGNGQYAILDETYTRIATVQAAGGLQGDLHEFVITPRGTALIVIYHEVRADTTPVGGQPNSKVLEGVVQEIDIASGELLFEWRSLPDVALDESFYPVPKDTETWFDYIHLNAVCEDGDALLVSARCTHTVYRIDRRTGEITWRLGGRRSDFELGPDAAFAWQHDVRRQVDGTISIFDNADPAPPGRGKSRALALDVDETAKTTTVVRSNESPEGLLAPNQGNNQVLPNGHLFVGWGGAPYFTEFGGSDEVTFHGRFTESITSYRSHRSPWVGRPLDAPAVAGKPGNGATSVYACWNGATEVAAWRVLAGPDEQHVAPVLDAPRSGFETRMEVGGAQAYVAVQALDANGVVLGTSPTVPVA